MVFHVHFSPYESSGEIRRIRNIHKSILDNITSDVLEVSFVPTPLFFKKSVRFKLGSKKKIVFPTIPFAEKSVFLKRIGSIYMSVMVFVLCLIYSPTHIVGEYSIAWQALRFINKKTKCIIDVHGASAEEYEYSSSDFDINKYDYLNYLEFQGMKRANLVICQSEEMKRYLLSKYSFLEVDKIVPFRCSADNEKFKVINFDSESLRRQLGFSGDDLIFVYSGGLMKWQKIELSLKIFKQFRQKYTQAKFLLLTKEVESACSLAEEYCKDYIDSIKVISVKFDEVAKYLNICNVGFLIRDNVIMNAVAFPTKLAEYMMCGLPVISSEVAEKWIEDNKYIYKITDNLIDVEDLKLFIENVDKISVSLFANSHLSLKKDQEILSSILKRLN